MMFSPSLIWFLIGVAFLVAELSIPGLLLIFFAAGSWLTAIIAWQSQLALVAQIVIFIASSLILLFSLRKFCLKIFKGQTTDDTDDGLDDSKIGKTAIVTKKIAPHLTGEIKVMGSFWRAVADIKIEAGQSVIIINKETTDGLTFKVSPVKGGSK